MVDLNKGATVELVKTLSDDIRTLPDGTKATSAGAVTREVYSTLKTLNAYDITSGLLTKTTGTSNGITYTWNGDVCTVSGTSTSYSVNILRYYAPIPDDIIPGGTFYVCYQTTDPNIMLRIMWRDVNNTDISAEYLTANSIIRVPDNAAIWTIGLYITPDKVIDGAEVSGVAVLNSPSNKDIINHFMTGKEMLANGSDLNDVRNEGHYLLVGSANYAYSNSPLPTGYAGTLIVFRSDANIVCQMVVSIESDAKIYVRTSVGGTFSAAWKEIGDVSGVMQELANYMTGKGVLATNTDLDTVKNEGHYLLIGGSPNYVYTNSPVSSSVAGTLIVFRSHADVICQMVVSVESDAKIYVRTSTAGTFSAVWKEIGDASEVMQELTNYMVGKGVLETNTDLDTVKNEGHYLLIGGSPNYAYTNSPIPSSVAGTLVVFRSHANVICQMVVSLESDAKIYVRTSSAGTFSMPWKSIGDTIINGNNYITQHYENTYQITCTPTITTDTNQFLASTGDNTDRTGDIQAILNAGYTCRLGPGRFVVTGIEIPDYGTLEGCTNSTMLLLADSVSTGYAVKLKSYSTIKNVRISGGASAITLSSTVGTRHGILFEGTKRSGSTAGTTYYRSRIHQCQITSFTGGGITCTGTGVDRQSHLLISDCEIAGCNAGIYIPYYSEFHRITNCVMQDCYYGCVNNGGNNNFSNCDFSGNRIGVLIDNSSDQSVNNSHGTFSACSINHSYSDAGVMNQGTAIRLLKSNLGEIFTGMQIFYGAIEIENCMGIQFIGANIGSKVPITVTGSTVISFSDCTFKDAPDSTDSPFTQSGNTAVKFTDCYLHDGTVYNPV